MEATIVNFRRGRHHQKDNQMVIEVSSVSNKEEAAKLVGKTVVWTSPAKKELKGKIAALHGNKGNLRVIFETGMPGQSKGSKVVVQ
jgi:large subunit ribosomal protein L35Ae